MPNLCLSLSILVLPLHPLLSRCLVIHLMLGVCTPAHALHSHHLRLLLPHCGESGWVLARHSAHSWLLHAHHARLLHAHSSHAWLLHAHHRLPHAAHARLLHAGHSSHCAHTWLLHSHHARLLHTRLLHARLLLAHHSRLLLLLLLHASGLLLLLLLVGAACTTTCALDNVILAPLNAIILEHAGKVCVEFLHFIIIELAVLTQANEHHVDAFLEVEGAHLCFLFSAAVRLDLGPARHHWLLCDITAWIRHNDIVQNFLHLDIL